MLRKSATPAAESDETIIGTAVDQPVLAGTAVSVVYDRLDHDSVPNFPAFRHAFAELFDSSCKFMTKCQGHVLSASAEGYDQFTSQRRAISFEHTL